ncbi:MAG: hypothetical protein ACFFCZ_23625 [Promethearchaeota archaeon]
MKSNFLSTFLGTENLPPSAQGVVQKFFLFANFSNILLMFSSTFYVLFILDKVDYQVLGTFLALSYVVQASLDYPSGALGDWIGHKWVLTVSYVSYGLAYGILVFADSFLELLIVYLLGGFARSQESGALQSWFDNNYKVSATVSDPNREVYQVFHGKFRLVFRSSGAIIFVLGGIIATVFFRETVFVIQSLGMFLFAGLCLMFVNNLPGLSKPKKSLKNYFKILGEGVFFSFSSKYMSFFVISTCIASAAWAIWGQMILFPLYFGYTGSDTGAAVFRFMIWFLSSLSAAKAGEWSKKLKLTKWLPSLDVLNKAIFFGFSAIIIFIFPLENRLNLIAVSLVISFFVFRGTINHMYEVLRQRLSLDMIPDAYRNSVYSLLPTLSLIASIPAVLIAGTLIEVLEIPLTLVILTLVGIISSVFLYLSCRFLPDEILNEQIKSS